MFGTVKKVISSKNSLVYEYIDDDIKKMFWRSEYGEVIF